MPNDLPGVAPNPYDDLLGRVAGDTNTAALRANLTGAVGTNPDAWATRKRVANYLGYRPAVVDARPELEQQAKIQQIDDATRGTPALRQQFTDADFARLAHDDVDNLVSVETLLRAVRPLRSAAAGFTFDISSGIYGALEAGVKAVAPLFDPLAGTLLPENPLRRVGAGLEDIRKGQSRMADAIAGDQRGAGMIEQGVNSGFRSFGQAAPGLVASVMTGNPAFALGAGSLMAGSQSATKALDAGKSGVAALSYGAQDAAVEYLTEKLPLGALLNDIKAGAPFWKLLGHQIATEVPSEMVATAWQGFNEWAALHPDQPFSSFVESLPEAEAQTVIATLTMTGLSAGLGKGAHVIASRMQRREDAARAAEEHGALLDTLGQVAAASKVRERDPSSFEAFVASAAEDGPVQDVFIGADALMQSGVAEQAAAASPAVAAQLADAIETGSDIRIPVGEFAARLAGQDFAQGLIDHLRTAPGGMTRAEAQEFMQSMPAEAQAEVERAMQQAQADAGFRDGAAAVSAKVREQLDTAGRFTGPVNEAYASLVGAFYAAQAQRMSPKEGKAITAAELFDARPLSAVAQMPSGEVLEQPLNVIARAKSAIRSLLDLAKGDKRYTESRDLFEVTAEEAREAKAHGLDIDGFRHAIDGSAIRHTFKSHGNEKAEAARGQIAVTDTDIESIPDILAEPDTVVYGLENKIGRPIIGYIKQMPDGSTLYLEEVRTGRRTLTAQSMRRYPRTTSAASILETLRPTSETLPGDGFSVVDRPEPRKSVLEQSMPSTGARGTYSPSTNTIALLKAADLSTFLHESGHAFLEMLLDFAGVVQGTFVPAPRASASLKRESKDGGRVLTLHDPAGQSIGSAWVMPRADAWRVKNIGIDDPEARGKGYGAQIYEDLAAEALAQGKALISDQSVSEDAARVWESLARRGYTVEKNQNAVLEDGSWVTRGDWVFRLTAAPEKSTPPGQTIYSDGEAQLRADAQTLLSWFGLSSLEDWYSLDFEEKRAYHERFAESFEHYLFSGKAPSIELAGAFQRFRSWLLSVYKSLKDFIAGHPEAGKLTDDVRAIMDRMLATDEQIALAEQSRSLMPMFATAQQGGMSPDEFEAYHALGAEATAAAAQEFEARSLRDLAWSRNARGREVAKLQRRAAAQRRDVRSRVRGEVMARPVYRAWQFLTAKMAEGDKLAPGAKPPKSDPNAVDETLDSLFVAIAKLGGLRRDEVEAKFGFDKKERSPTPVFGKPLLRKTGGLSLDDMAEALADYGYLSRDEHGKHDVRDLEDRFGAEYRGDRQWSAGVDPSILAPEGKRGENLNTDALGAGRLDATDTALIGAPEGAVARVKALGMTDRAGLHPDVVAEMFGFGSGDELVRALADAPPPLEMVEHMTDLVMLSEHGDLATPDAIEAAADRAVHNEVRARMIATEQALLARAAGGKTEQTGTDRRGRPVMRPLLPRVAREMAAAMIARLKVRDLNPQQFAHAEARAGRNSEKAQRAGEIDVAAAEKRNQLVQHYATRAAYDAQDEVDAGVRYLRRFERDSIRRTVDPDYVDQIQALLERYDLATVSGRKLDKRASLRAWVEAQREQGMEPDIPADILDAAGRTNYREMTVEQFRGLIDAVRQIEHLGRLKNRLLTAQGERQYAAVRDEMADSINEHAGDRQADTRTATTRMGRAWQKVRGFGADHIKAATLAFVLDGGKAGPVWEYMIRPANEAGDRETVMRADATQKLADILAPVFKLGPMGGKGQFFESVGRSLNRESRLAIALNMGNAGNLQRLLGGEGWTMEQIAPIANSLTAAEWQAVQAIWDHFETYRPAIGAKERRIYGKEPEWIQPQPLTLTTADGQRITLKGGYYPVKYDPAASIRAEEHADAEAAKAAMRGAYTSATTRRSFTKSRAEEVNGRPLLYTLSGLYSGVNEVIHDLAWHEWLIDAGRLLRSDAIDRAIREHYGPDAKRQLKTWMEAVAQGEGGAQQAGDQFASFIRQGVSAAGLGFNLLSGIQQITGYTQSVARLGARWAGVGLARFLRSPIESGRFINERSDFMAMRSRTRYRELNELRNRVEGQSTARAAMLRHAYTLIVAFQQLVDRPTWLGAYERAMAAGEPEDRAAALADQAVIDTQGGGQVKDLSAIERGGPALKLFTVFYSFMNVSLNLGVGAGMTERGRAKLAAKLLLLYVAPVVLSHAIRSALVPSGDDDDEFDLAKLAKALAAEQIDYLFGLMVGVREASGAAKMALGLGNAFDAGYSGPAGVRGIGDLAKFAQQVEQGEFDDAFRKSAVNLLGDTGLLPGAAQINRTITGAEALADGETANPLALAFGFKRGD